MAKARPGIVYKAKQFAKDTKSVISHAIKTGEIRAISEVIQRRLDICFKCEKLDKQAVVCNLCGCHMRFKTTLEVIKCPINKW